MEKLKSITIDTYLRLGCAQADVIARTSTSQLRVAVGTSNEDEKGQGESSAAQEVKGSSDGEDAAVRTTTSAATQTQVSMTLKEVDRTWTQLQRFLDINDSKVRDVISCC